MNSSMVICPVIPFMKLEQHSWKKTTAAAARNKFPAGNNNIICSNLNLRGLHQMCKFSGALSC